MASSGKPPVGFKIFAFAMVGILVVSSLVVFGGAAFGGGDDDESSIPTPDTQGAEQVERLRTQVADNPEDIDSAVVLANILSNQGQVQESLPLYDRAVNARPDDYDLRVAFGIALHQAGKTFDAQVQLEKAHELRPESAAPAYYLGRVYETDDTPDMQKAREWYRTAMELEPDSLMAGQAEQRLNDINNVATPTPQS